MTGEALSPLFLAPSEEHRLWLLVVLLALPAAAIAVVGLVKGTLAAAPALAGLVLLPAFSFLLGNIALMNESKGTEFCGSCHETMSPIVESLAEDNGSLASIHFREGAVRSSTACYTCHSGYGVWGGVSAKLAGMGHMLHTVTGNYEYPLTVHGFDIDACLDCHAESRHFRAQEVHADPDIAQSLLSGEMGCTGACHPAAHPTEALLGVEAWTGRSTQ